MIEGVFYNSGSGFADYAFSDSGLLVYMAETRAVTAGGTLEWLDRKGVAQTLPAPPHPYTGVRLSPDGQRLAMAIGTGARSDVWIYELARGASTRLTSVGINEDPVWTPDGRHVAFAHAPDNVGIYWVPADGSGKPELLLPSQVQVSPDSWTPDGKTLVYHPEGLAHIWILPVTGNDSKAQPFSETSFHESNAQVSPDGRWVAYTSDESGKSQVYARPFPGPGGKSSISIEGARSLGGRATGGSCFIETQERTS